MFIPIMMGSEKDIPQGNKISKTLFDYGVSNGIRISSAHKSTYESLKIIKKYEEDDDIPLIITVVGKSNALSGVVDSNFSKPVVCCPLVSNETMYDLFSSISMPSDVAVTVVLNPYNAALAALKICGLLDKNIQKSIFNLHERNRLNLVLSDVKIKYLNIFDNKSSPKIKYDLPFGNPLKKGKIRDIYIHNNDELKIYTSDRLSSFDRIIGEVQYKGYILNNISGFWFDMTKELIPNHMISYSSNSMIVKKTVPIKLEFVVRDYLTGSTETSIYKNYQKGCRKYCGNVLEEGMVKNQKLPQTLLTPTTKGDKDELIDRDEILKRGILSREEWELCEFYAHTLFEFGSKKAAERGLILVDTKYEFGRTEDGKIILIDELHTPDSSRYWIKHNYMERFLAKKDPDLIDKDFVRLWVKDKFKDPYDNNVSIKVPREILNQLSVKYFQLYEILTGKEFEL